MVGSGRRSAPASADCGSSLALPSPRGVAPLVLLLLLALAVAALEPVDATTGVDELLLARIEGVALAAELDVHVVALGRSGGERVPAGTPHLGHHVVGMD